jgi:hypothetical protein
MAPAMSLNATNPRLGASPSLPAVRRVAPALVTVLSEVNDHTVVVGRVSA